MFFPPRPPKLVYFRYSASLCRVRVKTFSVWRDLQPRTRSPSYASRPRDLAECLGRWLLYLPPPLPPPFEERPILLHHVEPFVGASHRRSRTSSPCRDTISKTSRYSLRACAVCTFRPIFRHGIWRLWRPSLAFPLLPKIIEFLFLPPLLAADVT